MKRLKLSVLLIIAIILVASVGSAALSSVAFDRNVSAGQILVDTDPNVAVQITNISSYTGLVKTGLDGKVTFDLNEAINNSVNNGFNTDATYSIGTQASGVIKIKNNSDIPVTVTFTNDANNQNALTLIPTSTSNVTIGVGSASDFYFTIDTNGQDAVESLNAVLHIAG